MVPAPCRSDNVSTCNPTATTPTASIKVLEQLKGFYAGQQVLLLWDGLSAHWSHRMRAHLDAERGWLTVEWLPAYAPELNRAEFLWANLKDVELGQPPHDHPR